MGQKKSKGIPAALPKGIGRDIPDRQKKKKKDRRRDKFGRWD